MLASSRTISLNGEVIERTPLLVPSFSSKGFPEVQEIIQFSAGIIDSAALVSAYDLSHGHIKAPFDFASILFLDSGGYEASQDTDLSEIANAEYEPATWTSDLHNEVLREWQSISPVVCISYDHPRERCDISDQVARARAMPVPAGGMREILLKPETREQRFLHVQNVLENVRLLADFDIIGVTEKEVGASIADRMFNIARIRMALSTIGLDIPIHVFGSLDTISTPLYFLAGADVFDGLTWLRFAYQDGLTIYKHNYGAQKLGLLHKSHLIDGLCWANNYRYMRGMEQEMRRFLQTRDFREFEFHGAMFEKACTNLAQRLGV